MECSAMITDCHAHLDKCTDGFEGCPDGTWILSATASPDDWRQTLKISRCRKGVVAALGIHPFAVPSCVDGLEAHLERLESLRECVVAVGEIGLDYSDEADEAARESQRRVFEAQMAFARCARLPVVLHIRKAWNDFFSIVNGFGWPQVDGVVHNFTGSSETARELLKTGLHLSFSTPILNQNAGRLRNLAADVPLEKILLDSDAPFRGVKPGELTAVATEMARLKGLHTEQIIEAIGRTFGNLFLK